MKIFNKEDTGFRSGPVPSRHQMKAMAEIAGLEVFSLLWIDGGLPNARPGFLFQSRKRRTHLVQARIAEPAGVDFFDYFEDEQDVFCAGSNWLRLLREARAKKLDAVIVGPLVNAVPKFFGWRLTWTTAVFDASSAGSGWSYIHGKKKLRQTARNAEKKYKISFETLMGDALESFLPRLEALHIERWRFEQQSSAFDSPHRTAQYGSMKSVAVLHVLRFGEELAALHYGLMWEDGLLFHTPVINIKFLNASPLALLIYEISQWAEHMNLSVLDFGQGSEEYKQRFANSQRICMRLFFPVSFVGLLAAAVGACANLPLSHAAIPNAHGIKSFLSRKKNRLFGRIRYFENIKHSPDVTECLQENITFLVCESWEVFVDLARSTGWSIFKHHFERFRDGSHFVCLSNGSSIISSGWVSCLRDRFYIAEIDRTKVFDCARVLFDFSTPVNFRRKGFYTHLLRNVAFKYSRDHLVIFASSDNLASIRAIRNSGFSERRY